jgi:hypothetical protein
LTLTIVRDEQTAKVPELFDEYHTYDRLLNFSYKVKAVARVLLPDLKVFGHVLDGSSLVGPLN